ncbi:MAG: hypothetical protein RIR00_273, partial [Pseudomonadota bacterium]
DRHVQVMGGLEATRRIRDGEGEGINQRDIPIYALTAAALLEERKRGLEAGVNGYLTKPLNKLELLDVFDHLKNSAPAAAPSPADPATPSPVAAAPAALDFDYGAGIAAGDQEIFSIIGESFLTELPRDRQILIDTAASQDWENLNRKAHTLKSLAATFGATPLAELLRQLEYQAQDQHYDPALLAQILAEIDRFQASLAAFLAQFE